MNAICAKCGENRPVCCDSGYTEYIDCRECEAYTLIKDWTGINDPADGEICPSCGTRNTRISRQHDDAFCDECCPNPKGLSYPWPTYERMDCDH